jgi:hypothetical protein
VGILVQISALASPLPFGPTPNIYYTAGYSIIPGTSNAFVSQLNPTGGLLYTTSLAALEYPSFGVSASGIAVDASGNAYATGITDSGFPVTPGAFQTGFGGGVYGGPWDAFVAKISPADAPGIAVSPGSLNFGVETVGVTSPSQPVALLDTGSQPLDITSIVASGDFAVQTQGCLGTLGPAGSCYFNVTFTPTATGARTGTVTITDNAAGSPHQLPLTGTGGIPAVSLTPPSLTFAPQLVGTSSPAQPVRLTNSGDGPLSITSIVASEDFAQSNTSCLTLPINPGLGCIIYVTFASTAAGTPPGPSALPTTQQAAPTRFGSRAQVLSAREPSV